MHSFLPVAMLTLLDTANSAMDTVRSIDGFTLPLVGQYGGGVNCAHGCGAELPVEATPAGAHISVCGPDVKRWRYPIQYTSAANYKRCEMIQADR